MPTFAGNLKDIGQDPRPGQQAYLKFAVERMAVDSVGQGVAGSTTVYPADDGSFTVTLASTFGLSPNTRVKMTGGWLGEDSFFELPPFQVPETDGTFFDLISLADMTVVGLYGIGLTPPPPSFNGFAWFDISGSKVMFYPREY